MAMDGDLTWGDEPTMQYRDDVWWNCAPETRIILFNQGHPNKVNKNEK